MAKTNPQIFHEVSKKVNCSPKNLLYVWGSWTNDIIGTSEAGWHSIWYNHRKRQRGHKS
ncbi:HAD family hydrolase [Thermaerobacillus caldiproteolyticus]|uniref:hypothetical protein n=1 Tax=Thermaerobacillus caldiproteolyticus TaxID=247480 RepID=UPI00188AC277|nr:hypothetical protein [Anoxybacillus caldiproteolyticus]QPA32380.1 hypothetical protein ISX45_05260 [Anoxybacillus caldiproteolyticus]